MDEMLIKFVDVGSLKNFEKVSVEPLSILTNIRGSSRVNISKRDQASFKEYSHWWELLDF